MQSSDRNMNWSSLTLLSCYIPLIHTPLCCKTLEQHFVHLPSFICILPHFSLTKHSFLWRQGYYYNPPFTDRKIETLKRLDDNLPSHILVQMGTENRFLGGGRAYSLSLDKYSLQNHAPSTPNTWFPVSTRNADIFFLTADPWHCSMAGWWQLYNPWGPNNPPCPQAGLTLSLLSGTFPLLPFPLMYGRALETMSSSWPHLRTAHWYKPQRIMRAFIFYQ